MNTVHWTGFLLNAVQWTRILVNNSCPKHSTRSGSPSFPSKSAYLLDKKIIAHPCFLNSAYLGWHWFAVAEHPVRMLCKHPEEQFRWREYAAWFLNTFWGIGYGKMWKETWWCILLGPNCTCKKELRYNNMCSKEQGTGTVYDKYWIGTNVLGFGLAWIVVS